MLDAVDPPEGAFVNARVWHLASFRCGATVAGDVRPHLMRIGGRSCDEAALALLGAAA